MGPAIPPRDADRCAAGSRRWTHAHSHAQPTCTPAPFGGEQASHAGAQDACVGRGPGPSFPGEQQRADLAASLLRLSSRRSQLQNTRRCFSAIGKRRWLRRARRATCRCRPTPLRPVFCTNNPLTPRLHDRDGRLLRQVRSQQRIGCRRHHRRAQRGGRRGRRCRSRGRRGAHGGDLQSGHPGAEPARSVPQRRAASASCCRRRKRAS
jgi:hypothetical protein